MLKAKCEGIQNKFSDMQVKQNDMGYMIDWLGSLRCTG
jgi:hypothetical protein